MPPSTRPRPRPKPPSKLLARGRAAGEWAKRNTRPGLVFLFLALVVTVIVRGPHWLWRLQPERRMDVVVVDKTVPFHLWREHSAFEWLLHAMKIRRPDGRFNQPPTDYVGYDPSAHFGHDLTEEHLRTADMLFIADSYGVYAGDYEQPGDIAALERSPRIYGGMNDAEAVAVENFANRGGLVVGEFNAFASPTEDAPRASLEHTFGVRWTHWVARYWPNLQDRREVPRWVGRVFENVRHQPFNFTGGGLVFVKEDADIVVLLDDGGIRRDVMSQERTGEALPWMPPSSRYAYWFDVVEAVDCDVYYEHVIHATPQGAAELALHGLRTHFPAVTRRRGGPQAWYFAGDFVDSGVERGNPERGAILWWNRTMLDVHTPSLDDQFFWRWYAPIMEGILSRWHRR